MGILIFDGNAIRALSHDATQPQQNGRGFPGDKPMALIQLERVE